MQTTPTSLKNFFYGWAFSYQAACFQIEAKNIGQGNPNHWRKDAAALGQFSVVSEFLSKIAESTKGPISRFAHVASWISAPSVGTAGLLTHLLAEAKSSQSIHFRRLATGLKTIFDHLSPLSFLATIVSGVALGLLSHYSIAAGIATGLAYEPLLHALSKFVSPDAAALMESWAPAASSVFAIFLSESWLMKAFLICGFLCEQKFEVTQKIHHTIDQIFQSIPCVKGRFPLLKECDAPYIAKQNLTKAQIEQILESPFENFEINPAHLTYRVDVWKDLEEDENFDRLLTLWEAQAVRWKQDHEKSERLFFNKLSNDDRFIRFLNEQFSESAPLAIPDESLESQDSAQKWNQLRENVLKRMEALKEPNQTSLDFMIDWSFKQLRHAVLKLQGTEASQGEQFVLQEARNNCKKLVSLLNGLHDSLDTDPYAAIDLTTSLLELAVRGGNYCNLGLQSASSEVLRKFFERRLASISADNPSLRFQYSLLDSLARERNRLFEIMYKVFVSGPSFIQAQNEHTYLLYGTFFKRGFCPLTDIEQASFGIFSLIVSLIFFPVRWELIKKYRTEVIQKRIPQLSQGVGNLLVYLQNQIEDLAELTPDEKTALANRIQDKAVDPVGYPYTERLALVFAGVLRIKKA